ncbi:PRC-barrel domain-containing protein [Profundibacterium mesophilum]|uniref:PRC-barrel domain containing protein n=1 Tax=Profundibacterium mesophilum KAUST100406-0324 TaxID=1037889 RepID=A0A921NTZ4_9RHOB|nr:PRC-barrel domain-containing protein [Profundibacterium mesophilum]KAF0675513.1 PRC-barrel domain containing protein [Profundibacterium mesophilum KAUST100406-0324]
MKKMISTTAAIALLAASPVIAQVSTQTESQTELDAQASDLAGEANTATDNTASGTAADGSTDLGVSVQDRGMGGSTTLDTDVDAMTGADGDREGTTIGTDSNVQIDSEAGAGQSNVGTGAAVELEENAISTVENGAGTSGAAGTDAQIDAEGYSMADLSMVDPEKLIGAEVYNTESDRVGKVENVLTSENGEIEGLVISVGGFLGIGDKPVKLSSGDFELRQNADADIRISTQMTEDQLKAMDRFEEAS